MFVRCSWSVVITLVLVALYSVPTHEDRIGLYEDSDLLEILDSTNFEDKVVKGNTSFVVEFYNSFCGHCIRFSSTWKEFGIQVYSKHILLTALYLHLNLNIIIILMFLFSGKCKFSI